MAKVEDASSPTPEKAVKVVSASKVKSLLKSADKMQEDVNELTSAFSTEVREAVKKNGLHKQAFDNVKKLNRLSAEKLHDYLLHWNHMMDVTGLFERAASAPKLPMGEEDGEEEEQPEPETRRGHNVRPFPVPAGNSAE